MSLDHLLLWLSAKGQGSWSQFRGAVEALRIEQDQESPEGGDDGERPRPSGSDLPVYQRARYTLQRLGHVEFFSSEIDHDWRIVPPAIALLPGNRGEGLLCGARSPDFLEKLDHIDGFEVTKADLAAMPQRIGVCGGPEAMAIAASELGLLVQANAATAILSAVPVVRDSGTWCPTTIPETQGWTVQRFSSSRLRWTESTRTDAKRARTAFFRFVMKHQRFYYLLWQGQAYRVPVQVGKFIVMTKTHGVVSYNTEARTLSVPVSCRPPLLIERALILCSGVLPRLDRPGRRLVYTCIPLGVARLTAQLLRQEIR